MIGGARGTEEGSRKPGTVSPGLLRRSPSDSTAPAILGPPVDTARPARVAAGPASADGLRPRPVRRTTAATPATAGPSPRFAETGWLDGRRQASLERLQQRVAVLLEVLLHLDLGAHGAEVAGQRLAAVAELCRDGGEEALHRQSPGPWGLDHRDAPAVSSALRGAVDRCRASSAAYAGGSRDDRMVDRRLSVAVAVIGIEKVAASLERFTPRCHTPDTSPTCQRDGRRIPEGGTVIVCVHSILLDPLTPSFFPLSLYYQLVSGLQLAKCTYAGTRADSRPKSGAGFPLKFSEEKPNCAFAGPGGPGSGRSRRPETGPKSGENRPKRPRFGGFLETVL
jgi:hypothetical protein